MHYKLPGPDLGLNFHPYALQITAYNRRTFETARNNLVINIMGNEGESLGVLARYIKLLIALETLSIKRTLHMSPFRALYHINKLLTSTSPHDI